MNQSDPGQASGWNASASGGDGWRRRLGELALACAGSFAGEEAQRLHELRRLLAEVPAPALLRGLTVPSAPRLEQLIAADAPQSAALAMLGPDCGYLLSRGAGGQHLASVILSGAGEEALMDIYDNGSRLSVPLGLWLRTTKRGGGFVYVE